MKPLADEEIAERKSFLDGLKREGRSLREDKELSLLFEVERARALLKRIEWSGAEPDFHEERADACPVCRELKSPHVAHKPDCELAALIGAK